MTSPLRALACVFLIAFAAGLSAQPAGRSSSPAAAAEARPREEGRPFIRHIPPSDYGGGGQNWAIVQDQRGLLYVGSSGGVLEYDGVSWRLLETPARQTVRSLAIDAANRIYVGSVGDFGYLAPDEHDELQFVSLKDRVPNDVGSFPDIWRTFVTAEGIIFQSEAVIFRWANDAIQVLKPLSRFNRASLVDGRVYLTLPESGLNVLDGNTFRPLPGTERLGNENYPVLLRYDDTRLLIGTRDNGLFLYDHTALTPFPTEVDDFLKSSTLYRGMTLPNGSVVLTSTGAGIAIMDRQGRRVLRLSRENGLPCDQVYYPAVDRDDGLWIGCQGGLARVETPSPASYFEEADGLVGGVSNLIRHRGRLFVASGQGVRFMRWNPSIGRPEFVLVSGVRNQAWWFASVEDHEGKRAPALLVAGTDGLYEIQGDTARPVKAPSDGTFRSATLLTSRLDPSRVWVGLFDGLASFRWRGGAWVDEGRVVGIPDQVRSLYENPDGSLWAGTQVTGLLRVRFDTRPAPDTPRPQASVERYGIEQGLPAGAIFVHSAAGAPYFRVGGDQPYVARFDDQSRQFVRQPAFEQVSVNLRTAGFGLEEGPDGRMFVNFGRETAVMRHQADGTWTIDKAPFSRFGSDGSFVIYPEADGVVWFSASGGRLVRFDTSRSQAAPATPRTLIRRVTLNDGQALFGGFPETAAAPRLSPSSKALRFEFAAPSFASATPPEFQSMLAGLDTDWSAFTREARRDYTNLGLGDYRFRVRARSAAGTLTEEAVYAFTILPPWYRTWWAYGSYVILLAGLVFVVDRVQRRRVIARERVRAEFNEARLRAESAEALANAESERKRNVELLSEIGREITASLDFDTIFLKLYERVNELADADVFGVGLYHPDRHQIEYRLAVEAGKRYAPYTRDTTERNQLPVWCIEHRQAVFINDVGREAVQYVANYTDPRRQLEDGSYSRAPESIIYLPLETKDRVLGIITIQSFEKNAYTEYDLNVLQSLASYTSVALDNADAYRQLNEHELEIRRLFEEAQQARAAAEQADAAKSAFLSTVSHELRTPLTSVLGFAKIIKKRLEERIFPLIQTDDRKIVQTMQQVEENLKVVVSEGERLTKLIDDVLDLAKIEAGKLEWHMESVTVADIISRATSATAALFEQTGLHLVTEVADGLPAVHGDRDRLIQVLINLISNAVKFTSAGQVTCRAVRDDGRIVVSVIDTGMGIAPADQPKVFERFKQVGDTLTDKPKGTGLGLPICREIVEHHGGRVWVESEFGKGSTFSFSLPVARDLSAARGPIDLPSLVRQLRDQVVVTTPRAADRESRILVVDDDANIRELLKQELEEAGYRVRLATNGREGLAEIRRERPDLVILDVMMPEMNGFDVAAVLKNDPATTDLPILILSIVQDKERGYRLGVDRYLTKPIDTELLFKEVGSLIEQGKSKKRVLVVDEDQSTVRTLSDVLTTRGYSVINAQGEDVVQRAIAMQPDIILLSSLASQRSELVQTLRFEKGLENVLFFVYQ